MRPPSTNPPRQTKLVCTIGPATERRIAELIEAGMDVARVNFSHGEPAWHAAVARDVRVAAEAAGRPVAILVDLAGPKIRLGELAGGEATLEPGSSFRLRVGDAETPGDAEGARVSEPRLAADLRAGDRVLLADGAAELRVLATAAGAVETEVVRGGLIRSGAGVAVPAERLAGPALTARDLADLPRVLALGADYVAQSFVRSPEDVRDLRTRLGEDGPPIVAKIETRPAVDAFDAILDTADAVMIARGDLGVELPYEEVPVVQKQLVRRALDRGVPTIVATQMLESMVTSPRPTRAEASDVANAVFDGADAIMLSGETAIGAWPILAAEAAVRIARACEASGKALLAPGAAPTGEAEGLIARAAAAIAAPGSGVAALACYTRSGRTARVLAALRTHVPVLAFSADPAVVRRLALVHGVVPRSCPPPSDRAGRLAWLASLVDGAAVAPPGTSVVLVASTDEPGSGPSTLEIHQVRA